MCKAGRDITPKELQLGEMKGKKILNQSVFSNSYFQKVFEILLLFYFIFPDWSNTLNLDKISKVCGLPDKIISNFNG